ncbi:MAG: hypothetical protein V1871_08770 [Planctomycetota bacterium]
MKSKLNILAIIITLFNLFAIESCVGGAGRPEDASAISKTIWVKIASHHAGCFGIKGDGTLWGWGDGRYTLAQIGTDTDWSTISVGVSHVLGLKKDGSLWAWGENRYGQLGDGTIDNRVEPVRIGTENNWSCISAGDEYSLAIKTDGSLWAWGCNDDGQLGNDGLGNETINKRKLRPIHVDTDNDWVEVVAGYDQTYARKKDGSLWGWGRNLFGELDDGTEVTGRKPVRIGIDNDWAGILGEKAAYKSDGSIWVWGFASREISNKDEYVSVIATPTEVAQINNISSISIGARHVVAIKQDGSLWAWGSNVHGQLGDGTYLNKTSLIRIGTDNDWKSVTAGGYDWTMALKTNGTLWAWGLNHEGRLCRPFIQKSPIRIGRDNDWKKISACEEYSLAIKNNGSLWYWGALWGEGDIWDSGTIGNRNAPFKLDIEPFNVRWVDVLAVWLRGEAIRDDGSLWGWGFNREGQLGDGTTDFRTMPVRIGVDNNWLVVESSYYYTIALKKDGSLWGWGFYWTGFVHTPKSATIPSRIGTENDWSSISTGTALKKDGTLWLLSAHNENKDWKRFELNKSEHHWSAIKSVGDTALLIEVNGTLWKMSYASRPPYQPLFKQVGADNDWIFATLGTVEPGFVLFKPTLAFFAIKKDGSLWAWGDNRYGQLGDGTDKNRAEPIRIGMDNDWASVTVGSKHTIALKKDGSLWAWGINIEGQLGDGTAWQDTPIQIGQ